MRAGAGLAEFYGCHRYAVLFYTLLLTLAAAPIFTALGFSGNALQVLLAFNVLVALLGVPGHIWRALLMVCLAVVVAFRALPASTVGEEVATGALVVGSGLALAAIVSAIRFALTARTLHAEEIYAALSAYLLAGLFFGVLHWVVAMTWPGSLVESGGSGAGGLSLSAAVYFSFVTLATLGYGDVVPRTEVARGLAVLEAISGQLYVAVTVARLVGARLTPDRDSPRPRP